MKYLNFLMLTTAVMCFVVTGCKSKGNETDEICSKIKEMYQNGEIKSKLTYSDCDYNTVIKANQAVFLFSDNEYRMYVFDDSGNDRISKDKIEEDIRLLNLYLGKDQIFRKGLMLVQLPKKNAKGIEPKVYDLFMSYVK